LTALTDSEGAGSSTTEDRLEDVERRLPANANVLLCTAAQDDFAETGTRYFQRFGHSVTVIAPSLTTGETLGQEVAALQRSARLRRLRETGADVLEWSRTEPLPLAIARATEEWA
jgi:uncharacterized protein (DUF58 family)